MIAYGNYDDEGWVKWFSKDDLVLSGVLLGI